MKVRKKIVSIILMATMILAMSISPSFADAQQMATTQAVTVSTESNLLAAIAAASTDSANPTEIVLSSDIILTAELTIPAGKYVKLKGNSNTRKIVISGTYGSAQRSDDEAMVTVNGGLTVANLTLDAAQKMRVVTVNKNASLVLSSGAIVTGGLIGKKAQITGAGIYMYGGLNKPAKLKMESGAYITGNVTAGENNIDYHVDGIGLYMGSYTTFDMNGGTISNNKDTTTENIRKGSSGGGVYIAGSSAKFNMNGGTISGNLAKNGGGGVYIYKGTFNLNGGSVTGNATYTSGGGIYSLGTANIKGGSITKNSAKADKTVTEVEVNSYGNGGGIYIGSESQAQTGEISTVGSVNMNGGTISGNSATSKLTNNKYKLDVGQGGGIYNCSEFAMTGGTITGNVASTGDTSNKKAGNGGGISTCGGEYPGTTVITGGKISGNSAAKYGKDIYLNGDKTVVDGTSPYEETFTEESGILRMGGSIAIGECYLPVGTFFSAVKSFSGASLKLNTEATAEGTVVAKGENYDITAADARAVTDKNGKKTFAENNGDMVISKERTTPYTSISGAAIGSIAAQTYTGNSIKPEPTVTLNGRSLQKGTDYVLQYGNNIDVGTAMVKVIGSGEYDGTITKTFTISSKKLSETTMEKIRDRVVTGSAIMPAVKIYNGSKQLEEGKDYSVAYSNNISVGKATATIVGKNNYTGTASLDFNIVSTAGKAVCKTMENLKSAITGAGGSSTAPAAIYIDGKIDISETINIPSGKYIYFIGMGEEAALTGSSFTTDMITVSGQLTVAGVTLDAARSYTTTGRALHVKAGGKAVLEGDGIVTGGNMIAGSGIWNEGNLSLEGGSVEENKYISSGLLIATGGGIYNEGTVNMIEGIVKNNVAVSGGGIYNKGTLNISGGHIQSNIASGDEKNSSPGKGGGIYSESSATITGGVISENSTTEYGGGIYNAGTMSTKDATVENNTAGCQGAGIYTAKELTMDSGVINNNTTDTRVILRANGVGGGVYIAKGNFTMNNGEISENLARSRYQSKTYYASLGNGGGVYVANDREVHCVFTMNGGTIRGNTAKSYISGNQTGHGGGVYVMGGNGTDTVKNYSAYPGKFVMNGGEISDNTATDAGSGVFMNNCEKAYNSDTFTSPVECEFEGATDIQLKGSATVSNNKKDNIYLTEGVSVAVTGSLTSNDESLGVVAEKKEDAVIAKGSGYTLNNGDKSKFTNDKGARTVELQSNEILLKAADIGVSYEISGVNSSYAYTGANIKPEPKILLKSNNNKKLIKDEDYTVSYNNRTTNTGEYTLTVKGIGECTGTLSQKYSVVAANISTVTANLPAQIYTGKEIKYVPAAKAIMLGNFELMRGEDYRVIATSYAKNKEIGIASMTIEGIGDNFTGTKVITFKILPKKSVLKKLKSKKTRRLTVYWAKDSSVTGYQILIGRNKSCTKGKKAATVKKKSTTYKTFTKLKKKGTYYVKVRAYKTVSGKSYYGNYSSVKKLKIK